MLRTKSKKVKTRQETTQVLICTRPPGPKCSDKHNVTVVDLHKHHMTETHQSLF